MPEFPSGGMYVRGLPLQYLLAASTKIFGQNVFAYRLPGLVFSLISVALAYWYARRFTSVPVAAAVAIALLVSSWHIEFAYFVRMYTLLQCLTLLYLIAVDDAYFGTGAQHTRSFRECRLLQQMRRWDWPVPHPGAARYSRTLVGYRADLITAELPTRLTLSQALQDGPIDLIVGAKGREGDVRAAYEAAARRFTGLLDELCEELVELRRAADPVRCPLKGVVACRMQAAVAPFAMAAFITPMAAVAGSVAEEILGSMLRAAPLDRAYVNNGGDIALHLTGGEQFTVGLMDRPDHHGVMQIGRAHV